MKISEKALRAPRGFIELENRARRGMMMISSPPPGGGGQPLHLRPLGAWLLGLAGPFGVFGKMFSRRILVSAGLRQLVTGGTP